MAGILTDSHGTASKAESLTTLSCCSALGIISILRSPHSLGRAVACAHFALTYSPCYNAQWIFNPRPPWCKPSFGVLSDGADFGLGGAGFQRLNLGCPRSILEAGLTRI